MQTLKILMYKDLKRLIKKPLFFIIGILLPFIATGILSLKNISEPNDQDTEQNISLHCLDASGSPKVGAILEQIQSSQSVHMEYEQALGLEEVYFKEKAQEIMKSYSLKTVIIFPSDFEKRLEAGEKAFYIYDAQYDERIQLIIDQLILMGEKKSCQKIGEYRFVDAEGKVFSKIYKGYSFSLYMFIGAMTILFVMGNLIVLNLWRKQEESILYARMQIVGISPISYQMAQILVLVVVVVLQCMSVVLGMMMMGEENLGISIGWGLGIIFFLGLQMMVYSLFIEIVCQKNEMVNYVGIITMLIQNTFAGLYFQMSQDLVWKDRVSFLFPQYWAIYIWQMIQQGKKESFLLYLAMVSTLCLFEMLCLIQLKKIIFGKESEEEGGYDA